MIDFNRPIGFSPAVGVLSFNSPSYDAFSSLSLGASSFAMVNPAMRLISEGYGTGAGRSYSLFGSSGMFGSYGLGAPMLGGLNYTGRMPDFTGPVLALWQMLYPAPSRTPGGPASAAAPQPPPPAPDETGRAGEKPVEKAADKPDEAKDPASAAAAKRKKKRGGGKPAAPTPKITAEFQQLLAKFRAAGSMEKMVPKDAKRLQDLARKYPSLIPKEEPSGDAKKSDGAPTKPDRSAEIAVKRKKLQDLERAATMSTLSAADQALLSQLRADPDLKTP